MSNSIQIQHGIEGSSKNYWSRGVGCVRPIALGSSLTHPTPRNQEFLLLLEINHVVFVLLYRINILPHKSLWSIISWRSSPVKLAKTFTFWCHLDQQFRLVDLNRLSTKYIDVHYARPWTLSYGVDFQCDSQGCDSTFLFFPACVFVK